MQANGLDDTEPAGTEPAGTRQRAESEALEILHDILAWRLTPGRWQLVGQIISSMATARAQGDLEDLRRATIDLELVSPVRVIKLGEEQAPPPEPLREQVNHLIHSLGEDPAKPADGDEPA
jgi:hypothetical protein